MSDNNYQVGITKTFPCSYLPDKEERLLIAVDERLQNSDSYSLLMAEGFRRSGEQSYRPHCPDCNKCHSLRVVTDSFKPSKSQKRIQKRNQHFIIKYSDKLKDIYYPLYEKYINHFHQDGSMFPANEEQFKSFLPGKLSEPLFIETWDLVDNTEVLICVAITDKLSNALSAVYTFYHTDYKKNGLGVFSILTQIDYCQKLSLPFLYLGYQIDDCVKMNYKNRYFPHERLENGHWNIHTKHD